MVRRVLFMLFFALALALPFGVSAQDATGSISGTVSNGTPDGGSVEGLTVTLSRFQGMELVQDYTTQTDASGAYAFKDLPVAEGEAYVVRVKYLNVEYPGEMVILSENANPTIDVKVYETTTDPQSITLSRSVVVAGSAPTERLLDLFEILAIENKTDRTYIGNNNEVLRIGLPDGTAQISPQPGFDFGQPRIDQGALVTTGAIAPGSHQAMVAYSVPYSGTSKDITIATAMPTETLRILSEEGGVAISSPALNDAGTVDVSGTNYHVLSVDKPIMGDTITVQLDGLPKAGASSESGNGPLYAGIAAGVGLLAAGLLAFQVVRRRQSQALVAAPAAAGDPTLTTGPSSPDDERLALAAELNRLDDRRAAGNISDDDYEAGRQRILAELRAISRQMRGLGDAEA